MKSNTYVGLLLKGQTKNLIFSNFIKLITHRIDTPVFELFRKVDCAHVFGDMKSACAIVAEKHREGSAIALKVEDGPLVGRAVVEALVCGHVGGHVGGGRRRGCGRRRSEVVAELEELLGVRRVVPVDEEREASESCSGVAREEWARHFEVAAADVNVESRRSFYEIVRHSSSRYARAVLLGEVAIRAVRSQKRTGVL